MVCDASQSIGDPSLLLNYCGEYWDGCSITPLTGADRKEIFSVFNRWRLEDYDVVAFSYTPVPSSAAISALASSSHPTHVARDGFLSNAVYNTHIQW